MRITAEQAAEARAANVATPADRPSQRRSGELTGGVAAVRATVRGMELRKADDAGGLLLFRGYASVTETAYEMYDMFGPYMEIVSHTAFDKTLARDGLDVPLVLDHDSMRRIARTTLDTLRLSVDENGLLVEADLDPLDADVAYIAPKVRSGLHDEMSFRFHIDAGQWSPDYTEYRINQVDIHRGDVSIVGYGANPYTAGSTLRARTQKPGNLLVPDRDLLPYSAL